MSERGHGARRRRREGGDEKDDICDLHLGSSAPHGASTRWHGQSSKARGRHKDLQKHGMASHIESILQGEPKMADRMASHSMSVASPRGSLSSQAPLRYIHDGLAEARILMLSFSRSICDIPSSSPLLVEPTIFGWLFDLILPSPLFTTLARPGSAPP